MISTAWKEFKKIMVKLKWVFRVLLVLWILLMFVNPVKPPKEEDYSRINEVKMNQFCKKSVNEKKKIIFFWIYLIC